MEQWPLDAVGVLIISSTAGGGELGRLRCNVDSEGGKYTSASPRCTCLPPRQHCVEVALGGKQVHLGCASVYLLSSSCNFNSSTPRPSSSPTRLRLVGLELGLGVLERSQWWAPRATSAQVPLVKSKFNSASPRWTWTWLGELERSRPSSPPPAVELIPKFKRLIVEELKRQKAELI